MARTGNVTMEINHAPPRKRIIRKIPTPTIASMAPREPVSAPAKIPYKTKAMLAIYTLTKEGNYDS